MKEIEEILRDLSQKNVTIPQQIEHRINYTLKTKQKNTYNYKIKKLLTTTISIVLVLLGTSGLVYGLTTAYEYINLNKEKNIPKSDDYVLLEELPRDYSKEQAILDNCVVIYNLEVISNNKLRIEEFVENTNNNKEDFIRIVRVQDKIDYSMSIFDIQYTENEYRVYVDQTRCNDKEIQGYIYNTYSKIELSSYNMNEKLTKIELTNDFKEKLCVGFYFDK